MKFYNSEEYKLHQINLEMAIKKASVIQEYDELPITLFTYCEEGREGFREGFLEINRETTEVYVLATGFIPDGIIRCSSDRKD